MVNMTVFMKILKKFRRNFAPPCIQAHHGVSAHQNRPLSCKVMGLYTELCSISPLKRDFTVQHIIWRFKFLNVQVWGLIFATLEILLYLLCFLISIKIQVPVPLMVYGFLQRSTDQAMLSMDYWSILLITLIYTLKPPISSFSNDLR